MIPVYRDNVPFFEFPNMAGDSGIIHGIFTRNGGASKGPYKSLNVSFINCDDVEHVIVNRQLISQCFGNNTLVFTKQIGRAHV